MKSCSGFSTSPHLSPSSSPIHRAFFPSPDIPPYPYSPGPGTPTHSCSPGPCMPSHKVASSAPGTPTLRGSPAARSSPARIPNANTLPRWAVLLNPSHIAHFLLLSIVTALYRFGVQTVHVFLRKQILFIKIMSTPMARQPLSLLFVDAKKNLLFFLSQRIRLEIASEWNS